MSERNACRACRAELRSLVLNLGDQPVADVLLEAGQLAEVERTLPLRVFVCDACGLPQLLTADVDGDNLAGVHGHGAAFSTTVQNHLHTWADMLIVGMAPASRVLDVSSSDDALLRPFAQRGMDVLGIEEGSFSLELARELVRTNAGFDLILVNHALAHASDLDDFVAGLACALRVGGTIAIEFHHALSLVRGHFDVACHAHRSYLSLHALEATMARHGLAIVDAEEIDLHGGSVRATAAHQADNRGVGSGVARVRAVEHAYRLESADGYADLSVTAERVRAGLLAFLVQARNNGMRVVGYGAPSRGITLLNYCAVGDESIQFTVDRSPAKQGRFLPGSRIQVLAPEAIRAMRPEFVLILPWALSDEIVQQMCDVREWGGRFVVAVPELRILD